MPLPGDYQQCTLCAKLAGMSETTITATKLRRDLGAVLDAVLSGRTVHVIRNGRPLCTLVPPGVVVPAPAAADEAPTKTGI